MKKIIKLMKIRRRKKIYCILALDNILIIIKIECLIKFKEEKQGMKDLK